MELCGGYVDLYSLLCCSWPRVMDSSSMDTMCSIHEPFELTLIDVNDVTRDVLPFVQSGVAETVFLLDEFGGTLE